MANEFHSYISISGPPDNLPRLAQAIAAIAHRQPDGEFLVDVAHFPNCSGSEEWFHLLPSCHGAVDNLPVRQMGNALLLNCYSRSKPPIEFFESVSQQYPDLECCLTTLELTNGIAMRWRSQAGQTELLERQCSAFVGEEIFEWEKQGLVWKWTDNRKADIEMMCAFISLDCTDEPADLHAACQLAYDALAFPGATLPREANSYAYSLACTIAEYRHALISPRRECDCRQQDLPAGREQTLDDDEFAKGLEAL